MADGIVITVGDNVSEAPARKIREIGSSARDAHKYVELLKNELAKIDSGNAVVRLQTELVRLQTAQQRLATETARTATMQERMVTQTMRTANAAAQAATSNERLAQATARTGTAAATAQAQLATAQARATAAQSAGATAAQRLQAATTGAATATQRLQAAQSAGAAAASRAQAAQSQAALAALRLQNAQNAAEQSTTRSTNALSMFFRTLALVTLITGAAAAVGHLADTYTLLQNRLGTVATSQAQINELTAETFRIAQTAGVGVGEVVNSFTRFDRALQPLGKSQAEVLRMTETITKALIIGGATTTEAASAMLQLSQGFNAGKLQGDEFRSVAENMPQMLNAIAQVMGKTRDQVKELGSQGKITSQVMFDATMLMQKTVDEQFGKMDKTIGQTATMMKNSLVLLIGEFDNATGASNAITGAFREVSATMDEMSVAIQTGDAQWVGYLKGLTELIGIITGALGSAFGEMISVVRELTGDTSNATNGMYLFETALKFIIETGKAVSKVVAALVVIFRSAVIIGSAFIDTLDAISNHDWSRVGNIQEAMRDSVQAAWKDAKDFEKKLDTLNLAPKFQDPRILGKVGTIRQQTRDMGVTNLRGSGPNTIPAAVDKAAGKAAESAAKKAAKAAENRAAALAKVNNELNTEIARMGMLKPMREQAAAFDSIESSLLGKKITLTKEEADSIKARIKIINENKIIQQEFDRIYEEATGPLRTYTAAQKAASDLLQQGAISQEQYNRELYKASEAYKNAVDPLREMNVELEKQLKYSRMRPLEASIAQAQDSARQKNGGSLTAEQAAGIAANITRLDQNNRLQAIENQLLDESVGARQKVIDQLNVIKELATSGKEGFTQADAMGATVGMLKSFGIDVEGLQIGVDAEMEILKQREINIQASLGRMVGYERDAQFAIAQVRQQQQQLALRGTETFLGNLMTLQNSHSKKLAAIGKAAAIAQAMINTYKSATAAYAVGAQSGGPWLGAAYAAIAVAAGMANVAQIKAQGDGFMAGGYTGNIGTGEVAGVVHGQEYVTNAAATRRNRPILEAMNRGADFVNANSGGGGNTYITNYEFNTTTAVHVEGKGEQSSAEAMAEGAEIISNVVIGKIVERARNGEKPFSKLMD